MSVCQKVGLTPNSENIGYGMRCGVRVRMSTRINRHHLLTIDEGGNRNIEIEYKPLVQSGIYEVETASGSTVPLTTDGNLRVSSSGGTSNAVIKSGNRPLAGRHAVSQVTFENSIPDTSEVVKTYKYKGARFHRTGWGDLGFASAFVCIGDLFFYTN